MTQRLDPAAGRTAVGVSPDDVLWTALGEMGRGASGAVAFLARRRDTDALVALLVEPEGTANGAPSYTVAEHHVLDDRVPGPCEACHTCDVPIPGWKRRCAVCGSDEMPVLPGTAPGTTRAEMLQAVRDATATQYEVLGDMPRADGGLVYFARDATSGALTVLRLLRDANAPGGATTAFSLATVPLLAPPRAAPPAPAPHAVGTPTPPPSPGFTLLFGDAAAASPPPTLARPSYATSALTTGGTPLSAPTGAIHQKVCPQCGTTYPADVKFCPVDGAALRPIAPTT